MIAALYNIPTSREQWLQFSFNNFDAHEVAARLLRQTVGSSLDTFVLDPIPFDDFGSWLYTHQTAHNVVNGILGLQGNDLSEMDPQDITQVTEWIELHAKEHVAWGQALGYG